MITEQYKEQIQGVLSCYDRVILRGTIPGWCFAQGMTAYLNTVRVPLFNYPQWALALNNQVHQNAERLAKENGIEIPTLCYHPDLEPRSSCRLCLVEIKGRKRKDICFFEIGAADNGTCRPGNTKSFQPG